MTKNKITTTLEARALQRACEILGSEKALSNHLKVPSAELQAWLRGTEIPPRHVFLRTVDLILGQGDRHPPDATVATAVPRNFKRAA